MIREKVGEPGERSKTSKVEVSERWSTVLASLSDRSLVAHRLQAPRRVTLFLPLPSRSTLFLPVSIPLPFVSASSNPLSRSPSVVPYTGIRTDTLAERSSKKLNLLHRVCIFLFFPSSPVLAGPPSLYFPPSIPIFVPLLESSMTEPFLAFLLGHAPNRRLFHNDTPDAILFYNSDSSIFEWSASCRLND